MAKYYQVSLDGTIICLVPIAMDIDKAREVARFIVYQELGATLELLDFAVDLVQITESEVIEVE